MVRVRLEPFNLYFITKKVTSPGVQLSLMSRKTIGESTNAKVDLIYVSLNLWMLNQKLHSKFGFKKERKKHKTGQ